MNRIHIYSDLRIRLGLEDAIIFFKLGVGLRIDFIFLIVVIIMTIIKIVVTIMTT